MANPGFSKFTWNPGGYHKVMNSPEVQSVLLRSAEQVRDACGLPGYEADIRSGKSRAHAMVKTADFKSRLDQSRHDTMNKSLGAGGV